VKADGQGFTPDRIEVARDAQVVLVFKRTTNETCATAVVFPALRIERELPLNQEVEVALPTGESRTLVFQCGMGMYRSQIVVR
jgi:plastocyanin domain-containing protein